MLSRTHFNVLVLFGIAALLLATANGFLFTHNRGAQLQLNQRQQFVQQTVPLQGLYNDIVKALAEMAVKGNDRQVLDMLAANGISVTANRPATATPDAAPAKNGK